MIAVSDAWTAKQKQLIVPESFVEISYLLAADGLQEAAVANSDSAAAFANTADIVDPTQTYGRYATTELNMWVLDGSLDILPSEGPYEDTGYVSGELDVGEVLISLGSTRTELLPGVTITWSEAYDEYATRFVVTAMRGGAAVASKTVTGNTSTKTVVEMSLYSYDAIHIEVLEWSLPGKRPRIEEVQFGYMVTFGKSEITHYSHSQTVSLVSGELPKNSISFALDNSTGRWNPNNPDGIERYLSDRQKMTVRYGMNVNGRVEWIKAGTFYLSEWKTPANGMEASFEARDMLLFMIDEPYTGIMAGTLYEIATAAIQQAKLPYGATVYLDPVLHEYSAEFGAAERTVAEVLQLCANAGCCVMYQDRDGALHIVRESRLPSEFVIRKTFEYSYPEFELSKPLARVSVAGGAGAGEHSLSTTDDDGTVTLSLDETTTSAISYVLDVADAGETQTVTNELICTEAQAAEVAAWVADNLSTRKTVSGEWRADPRLDALDNVVIESKFGTVQSVLLQEVGYSFSGAFHGTFKGYIPKQGNAVDYYAGELFCGEVV